MFPTDDIFPKVESGNGPRSYGPRGLTSGIVWHTTEGGGVTRAHAVATAEMQSLGGSLYNGGGSYNFIIYDGGLLLTVGYLDASGGLGTNQEPYWQPERYSFLRNQLPVEAYLDPNKYLMNVAFSGKTAEFAKGNMPANMIDTAARLSLWVQEQDWSADLLVHSGHLHWQTNRSDPSTVVLNKIQDRIIQLSQEEGNPFIDIGDSTFKDSIIRTTRFGLWSTGSNRFKPNDNLTRGQAAAIIDRLLVAIGAYNK